jgi:hypothetical protein
MIELAQRLTWLAVGAACAGVIALLWGMQVGARDAWHAAQHDRRIAVRECAADGTLPVLIVRDAARPERDLWTCGAGSLRRAGK